MRFIKAYYTIQHNELVSRLIRCLDEVDDRLKDVFLLSNKVLRSLRQSPGISCVLMGLRDPSYVDSVLHELSQSSTMETDISFWTKMNSFNAYVS